MTSKRDRASHLYKVMVFSFTIPFCWGSIYHGHEDIGLGHWRYSHTHYQCERFGLMIEDILNEFIKLFEYSTSLQFVFHEVYPTDSSLIIDKSYKQRVPEKFEGRAGPKYHYESSEMVLMIYKIV